MKRRLEGVPVTDKDEALFIVRLPLGQKIVPYDDVAELIATARSPGYESDKADEIEALNFAVDVIREEGPLEVAVRRGEVEVLDASRHRIALPFAGKLRNAVLTVRALRGYVESIHGFLEVEDAPEHQATAPNFAPVVAESATICSTNAREDGDVGWYDATLDAATWWSIGSITPREAAMLLCGFNPHDEDASPLKTTNNATGPGDFKRLNRIFEDVAQVNSQQHALSAWRAIAKNKGLKYHPWIDGYAVAMSASAASQMASQSIEPQSEMVKDGALQRAAAQDAAIIASLKSLNFDPLALPKRTPGKRWVKAEVSTALGKKGLWVGVKVFDKAWERLRADARIAEIK